jgi:predicted nuclease of restriction endonuclease-like RecB superfamily
VLTADLVEVRRRAGELQLVAFGEERRTLAEGLADELLRRMRAGVGCSREEVEAQLGGVEAPAKARKLVLGLRKILDDEADWQGAAGVDPVELRREVFSRAAATRAALSDEARFDRGTFLAEVAASRQLSIDELERNLFADLRSAEVLRGIGMRDGGTLVARYASEQVQAVLLRALSVRVVVRCDSPGAYRAIFNRIKFLRLCYSLRALDDGRYELRIDGPYSLFESVTRYGLQLALVVPVLDGALAYELEAEVRWGKGANAQTLTFKHAGGGGAAQRQALSDEANKLLEALRNEGRPWRAEPADAILAMPGLGLCVPDLALTHEETGEVVHVELLGFWSREAVWKRKALVDGGLPERIVFCASSQLRVSEELLSDDGSGALYVYKKVPSARVLLERVEAVAKRRVG